MKRLLSLSVVLIVLISSSPAQTPAELQSKIKASVENREYAQAIESLRKFKSQDQKNFEQNNYDYLLGRMAEKSGDVALAMGSYHSVAARGSLLASYARWHISQVARATGNLMLERLSIMELAATSPSSLLLPAARNRLARSFFESGNYEETIRLFTEQPLTTNARSSSVALAPSDTELARENLLLLADAYVRSNKPGEARETYNKLLNQMPNPAQPDDFSLAAAKGLDRLDAGTENPGKSVPKLLDTEHLRRASIYQFNRDFDLARLHYLSIIQNYPESGIVPDAIFQIGRGYAQQGEFIEGIKWFERVEEQFPGYPSAKDALSQAASCYSKTGKYKEAIARYKKFIDLYPKDERLDRAYLNIVDTYRDAGELQEALKWASNTEQIFKDKLPEAIAVFAEARIYLAGSDWARSLATLDRLKTFPDLGGTKVPGGTSPAEVDFLRGFCLEQLQRYDEAIDQYLSIPDGRNEYYGGRASERLLLLADNENSKPSIARRAAALGNEAKSKDLEISRRSLQSLIRLTSEKDEREKLLDRLRTLYKALPGYQNVPSFKLAELGRGPSKDNPALSVENDHSQVGDELLFLGLYDEAAPEVEASLNLHNDRKAGDVGYSLAVIYNRGDAADRGIAFVEPLWRNVPADYQIDLISRDQLDLLYPVPYADALIKYSPPRGVDPRYVLSIMRQESRYRAQIKSYAAARGLMQFISTTADQIAGEIGRKDFAQDELYDPPTAILFGSQYLSDLFKQFPDQPAAVAASYNGGDDNMKRWLARSKSNDVDRYVPEIIFSQSKDYVNKVMASYRMYKTIRDENLKTR